MKFIHYFIVLVMFAACGTSPKPLNTQSTSNSSTPQPSKNNNSNYEYFPETNLSPNPSIAPSPTSSPSPSPSIPPIISFTGGPGSYAGDVALNIVFPSDDSMYSSVEIRRLPGSMAPSEACVEGDVYVLNRTLINNAYHFASGYYVNSTGSVNGEYFSYRLCIRGKAGEVIASYAATKIRSLPAYSPTCVVALSASTITLGQSVTATHSYSLSTLNHSLAALGVISQKDSITVTPTASGSYQIQGAVSNELGSSICTATVNVVPPCTGRRCF